ncbi:macrophage mannose receptor 1-like [Salminus brasiliensis]|uniref:macrophage mannose receptor 1-like n=1 Tax=Salminus brasiliensis TaxID=930266 RepID=UPI003B8312F9
MRNVSHWWKNLIVQVLLGNGVFKADRVDGSARQWFCTLGACLARQYHFVNENKTWAEAQRYCREHYVDLATIDDSEENLELVNLVDTRNRSTTWIGQYDDLTSWRWSLDDDSFYKENERNFRNWYIEKPMNWGGNDFCVYLVGFYKAWWAMSCSSQMTFVCYDGRVNASTRYVFVAQYMNWTEAQRYCREHYTDLASVRNETENQKLQALFNPYFSGGWIGLYKTRSWSDKSNSSFSYWKARQPDNAGQREHCTAVSFNDSGRWTDENCTRVLPFLCYSAMSSASSRQYHFVNESKSWTEAQRYCRENYTDLATIDNMEEMNRLMNTVNGSYTGLAWIGLYDDLDSWRWSLDNDSFYQEGERDFRGWFQEPDNFDGKEMCVFSNSAGKWCDGSCDLSLTFVCYDGRNGKSDFVWINQYKSWADAQRYCRENYTDLASVRSWAENQRIRNITDDSNVWIGLYRTRLWSDQLNSKYENWRPGIYDSPEQPDNGYGILRDYRNQHCTAVSFSDSGLWTDENCLTEIPFICYSEFCTGSSCIPHQYHFINKNKTWTEAQRYCRENYTDLATVDNMEEMDRLITVNGGYAGLAWIGLYEDPENWRWSLDDDSFYKMNQTSFNKWYIEKPVNPGGNSLCVYLSLYGVWREYPCSNSFKFICYDGEVNASTRYVPVQEYKNWAEAQRYCRTYYTDLASVRNEVENQNLRSLFTYDIFHSYYSEFEFHGVWIGLYRTRSWSDKSNSSFSYWKAGQPDNAGQREYCTAASFNDSGRWTDENCSQVFPFICYSTTPSRLYHFVNERKSWTEAQRYCRVNYTDLATIDNIGQMNSLMNTANGSYTGLAWIGLYDDLDSWRWSLDNDSFYKDGERDFRGWFHEPDNYNGKEMCVSMSPTGEWFDKPCTDTLRFVCYDGTNNTYVWGGSAEKTWAEAQRHCRENYTDLASVRNETELQQILNISKGYTVWIGLYRKRMWSDQSNSSFTFWRPVVQFRYAEPNNGILTPGQQGYQHCTAVNLQYIGQWTDEDCLASFPFFCYSGFCTLAICLARQYHFVNENKTWAEAQRYCREHYVDLATIDNSEENLELINLTDIKNHNTTWIGQYDDLTSWRWSLDDDSFYKENERSFRNWNIEKPRNEEGNCLCAFFYVFPLTGQWSEDICSSEFPFVCYDGRDNASASYVVVNEYLNWSEAQRYCREHYTDLVSVRNEAENLKLRSLPFLSDAVWIGLYRTRSWSDKSNSSFSYWKAGQPDNAGESEYCTAGSFSDSGKWTDENCNQTLPFVCYSVSSTSSRLYHFVNESKSWTEAQRYCRENYTDLATIDNMEEMNSLMNTVNGSYTGLAWIGLYDDLDSWRWSLDDDSFYKEGERDFRGWPYQPNNNYGNELCVSMSPGGSWIDNTCTDRLGFVCYNGKNNTYVWISEVMTWTEAQGFCRKSYTDLASVRNETELQQIMSISNGHTVWIGLYRNRLWSDQSSSTFTYWKPGNYYLSPEPDNGFNTEDDFQNQHCTAVDPLGYWTDENCLNSFPFICYSAFVTAPVVGLRAKVKDGKNRSQSQVERLVLMELQDELIRLGLPSNFTLKVKSMRKTTP